MWIDWDYPESAVALHIYRLGRSLPVRSRNPIKSRVKIQLLTRTGRFGPVSGPVWPLWTGLTALDRSDRGAGLLGRIISSSGFQIGRSIYAFRSSWWDLRNGEVQLIIWQSCPDRSDRFVWQVRPVRPDCQQILSYANFECQHMPPCFLVKLAYQETFFQSQNCTETMKSTDAPITSCLQRWRNSINHISWYCSTIVSSFW